MSLKVRVWEHCRDCGADLGDDWNAWVIEKDGKWTQLNANATSTVIVGLGHEDEPIIFDASAGATVWGKYPQVVVEIEGPLNNNNIQEARGIVLVKGWNMDMNNEKAKRIIREWFEKGSFEKKKSELPNDLENILDSDKMVALFFDKVRNRVEILKMRRQGSGNNTKAVFSTSSRSPYCIRQKDFEANQ